VTMKSSFKDFATRPASLTDHDFSDTPEFRRTARPSPRRSGSYATPRITVTPDSTPKFRDFRRVGD
jgi:hypothetical protein